MERPAEWLFPDRQGRRHAHPRRVGEACARAAQRAGLTKRVTPHAFRHSFATHLLEANEVADIFRRHGAKFLRRWGRRLGTAQRLALRALPSCRAAALGGHIDECDRCGHRRPSFNSCRNRHCPKCRAAARGQWLEARRAELLPVPYFHVVFTLPAAIAEIALQNPALLYDAIEFIRRFLLHVLPAHFVRIRQYGFLANCQRHAKLEVCRRFLKADRVPEREPGGDADFTSTLPADEADEMADHCPNCPNCRVGRMRTVETKQRPTTQQVLESWPFDSS